MNNANNQAFPRAGFSGPKGYGTPTDGLTKREHFALELMKGYIANTNTLVVGGHFKETQEMQKAMSTLSISAADVLLEELSK